MYLRLETATGRSARQNSPSFNSEEIPTGAAPPKLSVIRCSVLLLILLLVERASSVPISPGNADFSTTDKIPTLDLAPTVAQDCGRSLAPGNLLETSESNFQFLLAAPNPASGLHYSPKEDHSRLFGPPPRRILQQAPSEETQDSTPDDCSLNPETRDRLRDPESGTWMLGAAALGEIDNDLQIIVNCTAEGDVILFDNVEDTIKLPSTTIISKSLTLATKPDSANLLADLSKTNRTTKFSCDGDGRGLFIIKSKDVAFANLEFRDCDLKGPSSVIKTKCTEPIDEGIVRLHHLSFVGNSMHKSPALDLDSPCSRVEMVDILFEGNDCSGHCLAQLSYRNSLSEITIESNVCDRTEDSECGMISAPLNSTTNATTIKATENNGSLFSIAGGSMSIDSSDFGANHAHDGAVLYLSSGSEAYVERCASNISSAEALGSFAFLKGGSKLTINNSEFRNGSAVYGGFFYAHERSNLSIENCIIADGNATFGGGIQILHDSKLLMQNTTIRRSNARLEGGAVHTEFMSNATVTNSKFLRCSSSVWGGAIYSDASDVSLTKCVFSRNKATLSGGAVEFQSGTIATVLNSKFKRNSAEFGGAVEASGSAIVEILDCSFKNNSAKAKGGAVISFGSNIRVDNSSFRGDRADFGAGVAVFGNSSANITNNKFYEGNGRVDGGGVHVSGSGAEIHNCTFEKCISTYGGSIHMISAEEVVITNCTVKESKTRKEGGGLSCYSSTEVELHGSLFQDGEGNNGGGAIMEQCHKVSITNSAFLRNKGDRGSAIKISDSDVQLTNLTISENKAGVEGALYCDGGSNVTLSGGDFRNNAAEEKGGAVSISGRCHLNITDVEFVSNNGSLSGGAIHSENSSLRVKKSKFIGNTAKSGGALYMSKSSNLTFRSTEFESNNAELDGGTIFIMNSIAEAIESVTIKKGEAKSGVGGAVYSYNSNLTARNFSASNCSSAGNGGAISLDQSLFNCTECFIRHNVAKNGSGGGISASLDAPSPHSDKLILTNSNISDNTAKYGGGLHIVTAVTNENATGVGEKKIELIETILDGNSANATGGAIFANNFCLFRVKCSGSFCREEEGCVKSYRDCCEWEGNKAEEGSGNIIASYATSVNVKINNKISNPSRKIINYSSGQKLPTIELILVDEFDNQARIGVKSENITAYLSSQDNFIAGKIEVEPENGKYVIDNLTGFGESGYRTVEISFSEPSLPNINLTFNVRNCVLGEWKDEKLHVCVNCTGDTYNFYPNKKNDSLCTPCPPNSNCTGPAIFPQSDYWHSHPCSEHMQKCLSKESCNSSRDPLQDTGRDKESCNDFDDTEIRDYRNSLCNEGYEGPLCGSCSQGYGKSYKSECAKCRGSAINVLLIFATTCVLCVLAAVTVRGNLVSHADTSGGTGGSATDEEAARRESVAEESRHQSYRRRAKKADIRKAIAIELFKISIDFTQTIAIAISINVEWTTAMIKMFEAAEFMGAVTSEAASLSVDCLVSHDGLFGQSVSAVLVNLFLPVWVIILIVLFWLVVKIKLGESVVYWVNRSFLSAIAVSYISYISLTTTLVQTLNCIDVHNSTNQESFNSTTPLWSKNTTLRCYEGEHATLARVFGIPGLILFSLGFPAAMALIIIKTANTEGGWGRWICDVAGFMYQSYQPESIYWGSVVMVRKAILTVIVVFAYPLGGNLQAILAVLVLIVSLVLHTCRLPYAKEFESMNNFEQGSLLVSLVTFVSSLFLNDSNVGSSMKVLVSTIVLLLNSGLLMIYGWYLFCFLVEYMRADLELQAEEGDWKEAGRIGVIKEFFGRRLSGLRSQVRRLRASSRSQDGDSMIQIVPVRASDHA